MSLEGDAAGCPLTVSCSKVTQLLLLFDNLTLLLVQSASRQEAKSYTSAWDPLASSSLARTQRSLCTRVRVLVCDPPVPSFCVQHRVRSPLARANQVA